jgi:hypothetical protein
VDDGKGIGIDAPATVTTDGGVNDEELGCCRHAAAGDGTGRNAVDLPDEAARLPVQRINVPVRGRIADAGSAALVGVTRV